MSNANRQQLHPILIAEDSINDAALLEIVFKRARILNPLQMVHDGDEAIEYLRGEGTYGDRQKHPMPVLFLLDLKMPRKGGMDVLRWLADNPLAEAVPVVIIAGAGEMREVNCAYSLGARSFLIKPLNWLDVMELLSCFRELRMAAEGDNYVLEPVQTTRPQPVAQKPELCGYKPQPLDTSRLKLTDDILRLTELLAENNHEVWARDRMAQGWTYGHKRDDDRKEHPCLVPYRDLPESEKLVDRNVALETIKTIFSFGLPFPVLEKATDTMRSEVMSRTANELAREDILPDKLRNIWEEHNSVVWAQSRELYRKGIEAALRCGEAFLALEIVAEGLKKFQSDVALRQTQALALARTGAVGAAHNILEQLRSSSGLDGETVAALARTYLELAELDPAAKRRHLKLSFELYNDAYHRTGTHRNGLGAAITALLYGEGEAACRIAAEVESIARAGLEKAELSPEERYALYSAIAASFLVRGNIMKAEENYLFARHCAGPNGRLINAARAEARALLERTGQTRRRLDVCFDLPPIVVCSGHMFDKPERRHMRFPFGMEERVREEMRRKLKELKTSIGFSSLSSGAEMLFAETMLERSGEVHIVLPCNRQEFKRARVDIIPGAKLGERFDAILAKASSITVLEEVCDDKDLGIHEYCNRVLVGNSLVKGRLLDLDVTPLAVWDGRPANCERGTKGFIELWEKRETPVEFIRIDKILEEVASQDIFVRRRQELEKNLKTVPDAAQEEDLAPHVIKGVLFAEIVGHNRLTQSQMPKFIQHFLTRVSEMMDSWPNAPFVRNTWGNNLQCVFDDMADAGRFALALQELTQKTDWIQLGLPANLHARITLHAGPVYPCVDPVSAKLTFLGAHVNRATQIEPIADEGQIYATESFATLSESHGITDYRCEYVGQKQLAQRYETVRVFMVRRAE